MLHRRVGEKWGHPSPRGLAGTARRVCSAQHVRHCQSCQSAGKRSSVRSNDDVDCRISFFPSSAFILIKYRWLQIYFLSHFQNILGRLNSFYYFSALSYKFFQYFIDFVGEIERFYNYFYYGHEFGLCRARGLGMLFLLSNFEFDNYCGIYDFVRIY